MDFLRSIGVIRDFQIEIPGQRSDFVKMLSVHTDKPAFSMFDQFSDSPNIYKGKVRDDWFELRKKRKRFDRSINFGKITGRISQRGEKVLLHVEVNAFPDFMILYYFFLVIVYGAAISQAIFSNSESFPLAIPLIIMHGTFMFGVPYVVMRTSIGNIKYNLERDFFFMMRSKLTPVK